jgi:hypothetical protein
MVFARPVGGTRGRWHLRAFILAEEVFARSVGGTIGRWYLCAFILAEEGVAGAQLEVLRATASPIPMDSPRSGASTDGGADLLGPQVGGAKGMGPHGGNSAQPRSP